MKKLMLFIFLNLFLIMGVDASEFSMWTDTLDPNLNYEKIEEEIRYKFYKEKEVGDYVLVSDNSSNYQYVDEDNFIYSEFSDYQEESCNNGDNIVEYKEFYPYQKKIMDSKYVIIDELKKAIKFNKIKVFYKETEIPFEFATCPNCISNLDNIVEINNRIVLQLDDYYDAHYLTFYIEADSTYQNILYTLLTSNDIEGKYIAIRKIANSNLYDYIPNDRWFSMAEMSPILYSDIPVIEDENTIIYPKVNMCRYKEKMVYKYNIEKEYYDDNYHINVDGYIRDLDNSKTYYRYILKKEENLVNNNISNNINNTDNINNENLSEEDTYKEEDKKEDKEEDEILISTETPKKTSSNGHSIVNPLSINSKSLYIKYIILLVILLTIAYIFHKNKKCKKSR